MRVYISRYSRFLQYTEAENRPYELIVKNKSIILIFLSHISFPMIFLCIIWLIKCIVIYFSLEMVVRGSIRNPQCQSNRL